MNMISNKPSGPRSRSTTRPTPALDLTVVGPTVHVHPQANRAYSATPLSPSEPPRFQGPVLIVGPPVPPGMRSAPRIPQIHPVEAGSPTSPVDINDRRPNSVPTAPESATTIRADETYSPENQHNHRPALHMDGRSVLQAGRLTKHNPVEEIRDVIHRIAIKDSNDSWSNNDAGVEPSPDDDTDRSRQRSSGAPGARRGSSRFRADVPKSNSQARPPAKSPTAGPRKEFSDEHLEVTLRLGEGAGGAVHKVVDKRDGATYARKIITTRDSASIKQVVRELRIISEMRHRNIILSYGAYMSPSSSEVKILMEYGEGGSLESIGAKLREVGAVVGEKTAGRIAEGILQGLAYLQTKSIIHRDIKPSNILLSGEGVVKLCDFGVSRELVNSNVGTFTGTLMYMAPERIAGGEYNVRSDVWSAGISLLELVQNKFPFPSDLPAMEVVLMIRTGESPKLEDDPDSNITWSSEMKDFIKQALTHDGAQRPAPKELLDHPWINTVMHQEVHMARWIGQVWGWKTRKERSSTTDAGRRPSSSGSK